MEKKQKKIGFWSRIKEIFFPSHVKCIFCKEELNENSHNDTCEQCLTSLPFITKSCEKCGGQITESNTGVCLSCKSSNYCFDSGRSVFVYSGRVVSLIHRLKYGSMAYIGKQLGNYLCEKFAEWGIKPDYITSVPLHVKRLKQRKFNQSKIMAEVISEKFEIPYCDFCDKIVDNQRQAELKFQERRENVRGVYALKHECIDFVKNKSILLIDDVFTTGSTTNEVASVLKNAGADKVFVLTVAHTLEPKDR